MDETPNDQLMYPPSDRRYTSIFTFDVSETARQIKFIERRLNEEG
jgi:hypothetical protein